MSMYEDKHALYRMYVSELEAVSDVKIFRSDDEIRRTADHYINSEHARWMNILAVDDAAGKSHLAGFLIICRKPECHEHADYFVAQAYIEPRYRGRGLMASRLDEYLEGHQGVYCMLVYKHNTNAKSFWEHYFVDRAGYKKARLHDMADRDDGLVMLAFKPKKHQKSD